MRQTAVLICVAVFGLSAIPERARAAAVSAAYSYLELRQNANGSLDPRVPVFIDLTGVNDPVSSATMSVSGGLTIPNVNMIDFGLFQGFGAPGPVRNFGLIWRGDTTGLARSTFTMSVTDASGTVTGVTGPLIGPTDTAEFLPLVSNVMVSDNSKSPTVSWTNPADMSGVDRIRVRVVATDATSTFTEFYSTIISDLTTTSTEIPEGFLFAGNYQLRVQLEDTEEVTDILDGVAATSVRSVNRSTNITDITVVPLPGSVYMMLSALAAFAWFGRRRLRASH